MPEYTFDGPGPMTYPGSKDAASLPVGTVEPGEIRDLDEPLDHWWRETTDEDRAAWAVIQAGPGDAAGAGHAPEETVAQGGTGAPAPAPVPAPPAAVIPSPAPPAAMPPASAQPPVPSAPAATQEG